MKLIVSSMLLVFSVNSAYACPPSRVHQMAFDAEYNGADSLTPKILAKTLRGEMSRYIDKIPALSPREEDWLEAELSASNERRMRASSSEVYERSQVLISYHNVMARLSILEWSPYDLENWIKLSNHFLFVNLPSSEIRMRDGGVVSRDIFGKPEWNDFTDLVRNCRDIARVINTHGLLPSLEHYEKKK